MIEVDQEPLRHPARSFAVVIHPKEKHHADKMWAYARIVVELALVAYALQDGLSIQGWHWAGLIGLVLLVTAFFKGRPPYRAMGIATSEPCQ
jgi:hypothetical protein